MKSDTDTLIRDLRVLARDLELWNGADKRASQAADMLEEQQERIRLLISERDSARQQADQHWRLREEFQALLGTDDVAEGVKRVKLTQELSYQRIRELEKRIRQFGEWLNMRFDKAQKRYYEEQVSGDDVSTASTRAEYLAFRDACRDLSGFTESKEANP